MSLLSKTSVDDLWLIAAEDPSVEVFQELSGRLAAAGSFDHADFAEKLDFLLENLEGEAGEEGEKKLDSTQAAFLIDLARLGVPDSPSFRKALVSAVRSLLPPYLNKTPFVRSLGIRDSGTPLTLVAARFAAIQHLKNGAVVFLANSSQWGTIANLNSLTATVGITTLPSGGTLAVPLTLVLDHATFFAPGPEILKLADNQRKPAFSSNDYRAVAKRKAVQVLTDEQLREIAKATLVPKIYTSEEFESWWKAAAVTTRRGAGRRSCDGRSLKEVGLLLDGELADDSVGVLESDEVEGFERFFENLKPEVAQREFKLLAEVIAKVVQRARPDQLEQIFMPLIDKAPFWGSDLTNMTPLDLNAWGETPSKHLPELAAATQAVFSDEFLAAYAVRLPQRALSPLCDGIDKDVLHETFQSVRFAGGDFMLWLWKNRKKLPVDVLRVVNIENVVRALNQDGLPKAWTNGQRDLRTHLLDKADFQQQMIDAADGIASSVISSLQGANFFVAGERQSLLVKFSRLSDAIRQHLESGAGEQMLASAKEQPTASSHTVEPLFTSPASHRKLLKELDDIINVHQPENRESLKTARAHGDFRENSEFDAAKERRNYLTRRRSELERDLLRVQAVPFDTVTVEDIAVIGCTVTLKFADGSEENYHLLGAWDGDPERNYLSYKTRLGEAIFGQKVGTKLSIPGGRECVLSAVRPLSREILETLR